MIGVAGELGKCNVGWALRSFDKDGFNTLGSGGRQQIPSKIHIHLGEAALQTAAEVGPSSLKESPLPSALLEPTSKPVS